MTRTPTPPRVKTDRLVLREPTAADAPRLAQLANDFDVARMTTSMPFPFTRQDADAFLTRMAARDRAREAVFAVDIDGQGLAGMLGFHQKDEPGPEIGYWLGRSYWGAGYMTEAAEAAIAWARDGWAKRLMYSGHFADNPASGQVLVKAGFLYTGVVEQRMSRARGAKTPTRMMVWLA